MEWEYLQGRLIRESKTDPRFTVAVWDSPERGIGKATFAQLGADRWEIAQCWQWNDDTYIIFKRQKLHAVR